MSEAQSENPNQAVQEGAPDTSASTPAEPVSVDTSAESFPLKLVKRETGDVHWNVAQGIWETIKHAETGEPNSEYALLATIDGIDVPLATYNAGGIETIVRSQKQAQSQQSGS